MTLTTLTQKQKIQLKMCRGTEQMFFQRILANDQ